MPELCDFTVVHSRSAGTLRFGDSPEDYVKEIAFQTGGRRPDGHCVMLVKTKGLSYAEPGAEVFINGELSGIINPTRGPEAGDWTTELLTFPASRLVAGTNRLLLTAPRLPDPTRRNVYDDFEISDIVIFFHQATD